MLYMSIKYANGMSNWVVVYFGVEFKEEVWVKI